MHYFNNFTFFGLIAVGIAFLAGTFEQNTTSLVALSIGTALLVLGVIFAHGEMW